MKKALYSEFVIKFPLKLFLFQVIPLCFHFTTTENSQFFDIWRPRTWIRLISTVGAWNGAFWESWVFNIKKLDNSRKILGGNPKILIKVALFKLFKGIPRIVKITKYLSQQSMRNIKATFKQKGARIKFTFLIKELGSKANTYNGRTFEELIYFKWLNFYPEKQYLVCNDDRK